MPLTLALIFCGASGAALVSLGWPRGLPLASGVGMKLSLSLGYGIGAFSVVYFYCRVFGIAKLYAADLLVLAFFLALGLLVHRQRGPAVMSSAEDSCFPPWLRITLITAFSIALCAAVYHAMVRAIAYGGMRDQIMV